MTQDQQLLTPRQFSVERGLGIATTYALIRRGDLRAVRHPSLQVIRIRVKDAEDFDSKWAAVDEPIRTQRRKLEVI